MSTIGLRYQQRITPFIGGFILLVHVSGMLGMISSFRDTFIGLTPLNLMICFLTLFIAHEIKNKSFVIYTSIIILAGFAIEWIGVNTGYPFGEYSYGASFGPQWGGTPLIIGLNWFVLTYCGAYLLKSATKSIWLNAILVGLIITALDIVLEPVAINTGYWTWTAEHVPIQNYITWFISISLFSFLIYFFESRIGGKEMKHWDNPLVKWILGSQILFFVSMAIYYAVNL